MLTVLEDLPELDCSFVEDWLWDFDELFGGCMLPAEGTLAVGRTLPVGMLPVGILLVDWKLLVDVV